MSRGQLGRTIILAKRWDRPRVDSLFEHKSATWLSEPRCQAQSSRNALRTSGSLLRTRARPLPAPNEINVTGIDGNSPRLAEDEDGIHPIDGVDEQHQTARQAEIPKYLGHDAGARPLRC